MDLKKLREEQEKLSAKLVFSDNFDPISLIGGISCVYTGKRIICVITIYDAKQEKVVEKVHAIADEQMIHIPEFNCFRDGPVVMQAYEKITQKPDIWMVEGTGVLHPRKMGAASYVSLITDIPSIGVSANQLFGKKDGDTVVLGKEVLAKAIGSKDKAKPIFVSIGNNIALSSAVEIVKTHLKGHKMPEPIHLAHKAAAKIKSKEKVPEDVKDKAD